MSEKELLDCKISAKKLNQKSKLGFVVLFTIPTFLFLNNSNPFPFYTTFTLMLSGIIVVLLAFHLQFDANLFNNLASQKKELQEVDALIFKIFRKKMNNKPLHERIIGCEKLLRNFKLLLVFHILFFLTIIGIIMYQVMRPSC